MLRLLSGGWRGGNHRSFWPWRPSGDTGPPPLRVSPPPAVRWGARGGGGLAARRRVAHGAVPAVERADQLVLLRQHAVREGSRADAALHALADLVVLVGDQLDEVDDLRRVEAVRGDHL